MITIGQTILPPTEKTSPNLLIQILAYEGICGQAHFLLKSAFSNHCWIYSKPYNNI